MNINFEKLKEVKAKLETAFSTADMNNAINEEIEILRIIILETLKLYYPNVEFPDGNENFINSRIESARVLAITVYYDGMGYTGTIIGQLIGGKIAYELKEILRFLLTGEIFEDGEAKIFKKELDELMNIN